MNLASNIPDFDTPVVDHARKDFPLLDADMTVGKALEQIRREGVGERVIYFYAIDHEKRLVGVVPTRRLLTAPLETALHEVMVRRVVAIPAKATVLDACEFFVLYKFLAFPVVDEQRRIVGIIDANLFAEEILEAGDTEDRSRGGERRRSGPCGGCDRCREAGTMTGTRPPPPAFDEAADAEEQLVRLGIVRVASEQFQVGPYRYTSLADAIAQAERARAETGA